MEIYVKSNEMNNGGADMFIDADNDGITITVISVSNDDYQFDFYIDKKDWEMLKILVDHKSKP